MDEDAGLLMARVRARDAGAFEALYDQFHRLVYRVALRMLGDVTGAEDVTQAVFMKVWSAPELFRGGSVGAWIVRIARNRAVDVLRTRKTHQEASLPCHVLDTEPIEEVAFAHIDAALLRNAIAKLPNEQREAIELGFFGGITHEEIAKRTGIPLGTIKTRIRMGLRKLRAALDGVVTV